jgi:acetyl-CoA carboxylase biotin carboxyl carrier protein
MQSPRRFVGLTRRAKALYLNATRQAAVDLKDIEAIIELMRKNDLSVFELEKDDFKLKLQKGPNGHTLLASPVPVAAAPTIVPTAAGEAAIAKEKKAATSNLKDIVSPMVGTFYRSPAPDAPAFVEMGAAVTEDTVVGIIEAMKVMNEIKAEMSGVIAEVVAENAKPVQFGQVLFRVS